MISEKLLTNLFTDDVDELEEEEETETETPDIEEPGQEESEDLGE
jgi:hypothetical protein